ncbi:MAG TPA: hypothetical protein VLJ17_17180 [Xanthobacteraceae bacterium]|nr:hypothetical protein [Xanthobacteraceae bacterium]
MIDDGMGEFRVEVSSIRQRFLEAFRLRSERAVSITMPHATPVLHVDAVRIADRDANLPDSSQALFNQALVAGVKRLVTTDEQRRWLLGVECGP